MKLDLQELSPEAVAVVDAELKQFKKEDSEAKRIFLTAFALVKNKETWCQQSFEHNGAFCSVGAIAHATNKGMHPYGLFVVDLGGDPAYEVTKALHMAMDCMPIPLFNDYHTHEEVVEAWERAGRSMGWLE